MRITRRETELPTSRPAGAPAPDPAEVAKLKMAADKIMLALKAKQDAALERANKPEEKPGLLDRFKSLAGGIWGKVSGTVSTAFGWVKDKVAIPVYQWGAWALMGVKMTSIKDKRNVYDNPSDVNDPQPGEQATALQQIKADKAKEEAALAKLSAADRKRYEALATQVENRPMSRRALQQMLLDGRLPGEKPLKGEGTLLSQLEGLLTQPLAKGIDRGQLLGEVISEVENPVRINQHSVGTCGATTAQILLVRKNPAEYVRLVSGLATPKGEVTMAGGGLLNRHSDWDDNGDGGRSISSRLIQPPLMDEAEPLPGDNYDNSEDRNNWGPIPLWSGLGGGGEAEILSKLLNKPYDNKTFFHWNRDARWSEVKQLLADQKGPVPVALAWGDNGSGHFVQIDKIEDGKVHYTNPWGSREWIPEADFKAHVTMAQVPTF